MGGGEVGVEVPDPTGCSMSPVRSRIISTSANFGWSYSYSTHRIKRSINSDRFLHITYLNMKDTKIKSGRIINIMHTLHRLKAISCHTLKAISCYNLISI